METLEFIISNWPQIIDRGIEHLSLITVAVSIAIVTGVPIGIAITQNKRAADIVLYVAAMIMTIPSIALFGADDPGAVADRAGHRLPAGGDRACCSIRSCRSSATPIRRSATSTRRCARRRAAWACRRSQRLRAGRDCRIAVPVIMAGVRIAVVHQHRRSRRSPPTSAPAASAPSSAAASRRPIRGSSSPARSR